MANFLFSAYNVAIFVTKATDTVKIIRSFYTLAFVLINLQEEIGEKHFFSLKGGGGGVKIASKRT